MTQSAGTAWIAEQARLLGFDSCGVVHAEKFPEFEHTEEWLARGHAGEMKYLFDPRRSDLQKCMPAVRSAIVCLLNYQTSHTVSTDCKVQADNMEPRAWISRYAWGDDYHEVLRKKLDALTSLLHNRFAMPFEAWTYVDTGPIQERILAKYAGLGWLGKNTLLLNSELGSYFFLGVILTTLDLEPTLGAQELPPADLCGNCRQCLDACPTQAFVEPYVLDARKCISYLTIELRGAIPTEYREKMGNHVFGCDICQDVCPWNQRAPVSSLPQFQPRVLPSAEKTAARNSSPSEESFLLPRIEWLLALSDAEFRQLFQGSAIRRAKWRGLLRNACIAAGNSGIRRGNSIHARLCELLGKVAMCEDSVLSESAQWALSRIQ
jgi:epoxyqueuosine reductase